MSKSVLEMEANQARAFIGMKNPTNWLILNNSL
jgi:hypothetical protein